MRGPLQERHVHQLAEIAVCVAEDMECAVSRIAGKGRTREDTLPRQEFMLRANEAGFSLPMIGQYLSRDHTTVLYGVRAARARRDRAEGLEFSKGAA